LPEKLSAIDFLTQQPARKIFFSACDCYPYLSKSQETCIYGANLCGQYRSALHDINHCYSLYIYNHSQKNSIAALRSRKKSVRFPSIQPMRLFLPLRHQKVLDFSTVSLQILWLREERLFDADALTARSKSIYKQTQIA
jgi:hypothetical protein